MTLGIVACSSAVSPRYDLRTDVPAQYNGMTAYIVDYDTGAKVDSAVISSGQIALSAPMAGEPLLARLMIGDQRAAVFVLEPGEIRFTPEGAPAGTPLNDSLTAYFTRVEALVKADSEAPADSAGMAAKKLIQQQYETLNSSTLAANPANPIGYYIFMQQAYDLDTQGLQAAMAQYPAFAQTQRAQKLLEAMRHAEATAVGCRYTDFEVEYNGKKQRLSDLVSTNPGEITLVDFWASWCGPCIRETRTLKALNERYGAGRGLNIVGVAVWDKPADTERAIATHQLPWPQIINAGTVPTDIYGISGIPHIMLIAPDGTIISRGLQGPELVEAVEQAISAYAPASTDE